jgi:hypothetical protein
LLGGGGEIGGCADSRKATVSEPPHAVARTAQLKSEATTPALRTEARIWQSVFATGTDWRRDDWLPQY